MERLSKTALKDFRKLMQKLRVDIRERLDDTESVQSELSSRFKSLKEKNKTGQTFADWQEDMIDQAAAAWVLACVFVRYFEDNELISETWLAGDGDRAKDAQSRREAYFRKNPADSDREYFLHVFTELGKLAPLADLFDPRHTPLWWLAPSADGAAALREFWQETVAGSSELIRRFEAPAGESRFLGDLYQDLSEHAKKRYALLQTPDFVESFILDRTLEPAVQEFGLKGLRLIDPTCGSGHFLLGAFHRLFKHWQETEPASPKVQLAQKALDSVFGVDINPFATTIARFRLTVAAMHACGARLLKDAPDFKLHIAAGDSLLWGGRRTPHGIYLDLQIPDVDADGYFAEDARSLQDIYKHDFHVIVGNPPYITVKDQVLSNQYRKLYKSCHRRYSLGVPFTELFFELACLGEPQGAGYVGMITTNSFMKREFGTKLIGTYFPSVDLTHIIDSSGAYIPGHGTPTVILYGRHRKPISDRVSAILGIRGEPETPEKPHEGKVWQSILRIVSGTEGDGIYVTGTTLDRKDLAKHPWVLSGGGALETKRRVEESPHQRLSSVASSIGYSTLLGEDDVYIAPRFVHLRKDIGQYSVPLAIGDGIRDWQFAQELHSLFPYVSMIGEVIEIETEPPLAKMFWAYRTVLRNRKIFGKKPFKRSLSWFEHIYRDKEKLKTEFSIIFAFVATHNHFVLDRGGKVFKQSAPVIKLPPEATENDHLALLGLLNSSTACFWMKQVFHNKGATSDRGVLQSDPEKLRFEFDSTKLATFPIPKIEEKEKLLLTELARTLTIFGQELGNWSVTSFVSNVLQNDLNLKTEFKVLVEGRDDIRSTMVWLQEELDWLVYQLYRLIPKDSDAKCRFDPDLTFPKMGRNARPYRQIDKEIVNGTREDQVTIARTKRIRSDGILGMIESPAYKRRWSKPKGTYSNEELTDNVLIERGLKEWLLSHLESKVYWPRNDSATSELRSCAELADKAATNKDFMTVAAFWKGREDFDPVAVVIELVESASVPFLPIMRFEPDGLRKFRRWQEVWELQRQEDRGEDVGDIAVPPKYKPSDFQGDTYWRLRGKLDVPKERFISYPYLARNEDPTLVIGWAGWNHLQQASALGAYLHRMKEEEDWDSDRLRPILEGFGELLPWISQWHPEEAQEMKVFFTEQAREMDVPLDQIGSWIPPPGRASARSPRSN